MIINQLIAFDKCVDEYCNACSVVVAGKRFLVQGLRVREKFNHLYQPSVEVIHQVIAVFFSKPYQATLNALVYPNGRQDGLEIAMACRKRKIVRQHLKTTKTQQSTYPV